VTALTPFDIVCAARMGVYKRAPYFMRMLFKLAPVEKPGAGTFYVDEKLRVHFDPVLAAKWGVDHCASFLAHEVQHPLRDHLRRGNAFVEEHRKTWEFLRPWLVQMHPLLGTSVAFFWNVVADLEINPCVIEMGFKFPDGFSPVFPVTFKLPNGLFAEEYAAKLFERANAWRQQQMTPTPQMPSDDEPEDDDRDQFEDHQDEEGDDEADTDADGAESGDSDGPADGDEDAGAGEVDEDAAEAPSSDGSADGGGDASEQEKDEATPDTRPFEGCCGGCSGNRHKDEGDLPADAPDGVTDSQVEVARRQVAHDTLEPTDEMERLLKQYGKGNVPGSMERWAKAQLAPPEVPWQRILAPLVRSAVAYARGRVDWKFGRPSRRRESMKATLGEAAPLLPSLVQPVPSIAIVVDTSGSMQAAGTRAKTLLDEALSEVIGIVLATGVPCWAAAVDAEVQAWVQVKRKEDADRLVKGGGGTNMCVGIKAAEAKKCDVIVLITDGYTDWPTREELPKRSRLVTCIVGEGSAPDHITPLVRCNQRKEAIQWPSKD
jgi:predicted metal-dependent peptidase